jgi:transcriptional regulator with XRE-family HTH domain
MVAMGKLKNRIPELLQRKGLRDDTRYSQKHLAEGSGLADSAISRLMRYETLDNIPLSQLIPVAKWLEVHVEELVRGEETDD